MSYNTSAGSRTMLSESERTIEITAGPVLLPEPVPIGYRDLSVQPFCLAADPLFCAAIWLGKQRYRLFCISQEELVLQKHLNVGSSIILTGSLAGFICGSYGLVNDSILSGNLIQRNPWSGRPHYKHGLYLARPLYDKHLEAFIMTSTNNGVAFDADIAQRNSREYYQAAFALGYSYMGTMNPVTSRREAEVF